MLLRLHGGNDLVAGVGQFLDLSVAAEAETDRRARLAIIEVERAQHMAGPTRPAGAGGAERKCDPTEIGEQPRRVDAVAADVEIAVIAALGAAVDRPAGPERFHCRRP